MRYGGCPGSGRQRAAIVHRLDSRDADLARKSKQDRRQGLTSAKGGSSLEKAPDKGGELGTDRRAGRAFDEFARDVPARRRRIFI